MENSRCCSFISINLRGPQNLRSFRCLKQWAHYCWWKKSETTTWDGAKTWYIMGFQLPFPQHVSPDFFHQQYVFQGGLFVGGLRFIIFGSHLDPWHFFHGNVDILLEQVVSPGLQLLSCTRRCQKKPWYSDSDFPSFCLSVYFHYSDRKMQILSVYRLENWRLEPENRLFWKGQSSSRPSFLGFMLIFRALTTIDQSEKSKIDFSCLAFQDGNSLSRKAVRSNPADFSPFWGCDVTKIHRFRKKTYPTKKRQTILERRVQTGFFSQNPNEWSHCKDPVNTHSGFHGMSCQGWQPPVAKMWLKSELGGLQKNASIGAGHIWLRIWKQISLILDSFYNAYLVSIDSKLRSSTEV